MTWTTPGDIRKQVQKLWDRGTLVACLVPKVCEQLAESDRRPELSPAPDSQALEFPLELPLRRPGPRDLSEHFDDSRAWIKALQKNARSPRGLGYNIRWSEINNRQLGRNRVPKGIIVETLEDALAMIKKKHEAETFKQLAGKSLAIFPQLAPWLQRKPLKLLAHDEDWARVLSVLVWVRDNPQSNLYLRQIDVEDVDTKFIEARKALLGELLDLVLPREAINAEATGAKNFEARYGFMTKPPLIRFRILDERHAVSGLDDLTVRADQFAALNLKITRVYIIENEVDGLAFPHIRGSMAIFGLGYALRLLSPAQWLKHCDIFYWGDIDTHGFVMLDRLRAILPHARSLLMDRETLLTHEAHWTEEPTPHDGALNRLTPDEQCLFDDLRHNRFGHKLRLEQERVSFSRLEAVLKEHGERPGANAAAMIK